VWLDAEWPVLLAVQQLAAGTGRDAHAWQLAWSLDTVLNRRGLWHEQADAWQAALPAAGRLPHPAAATAHRLLGWVVTKLGDYGRANTHLQAVVAGQVTPFHADLPAEPDLLAATEPAQAAQHLVPSDLLVAERTHRRRYDCRDLVARLADAVVTGAGIAIGLRLTDQLLPRSRRRSTGG
jgi:hypothetical protein